MTTIDTRVGEGQGGVAATYCIHYRVMLCICYGECSEAKDQVEQLSNVKACIVVSVLLSCSVV
jgi:hypothetical protein